VHGAGVLRDSFLTKKTSEEIRAVLGPKVSGLVHLDEASREIGLDWLVCFGSVAGALGNVGQADYASANGFLDSYAYYRNELVKQGRRHGRTLTIDWPLWAQGGMGVATAVAERLRRYTGMVPLPTAVGVGALGEALAGDAAQVLVLHGDVERLRRLSQGFSTEKKVPPREVALNAEGGSHEVDFHAEIVKGLTLEVSNLLGFRIEDIDVEADLTEFGFDSISVMKLTEKISEKYKIELSPTVFFEHNTLEKFARYIADQNPAEMRAVLLGDTPASSPEVKAEQVDGRRRQPRRTPIRAQAVPVQPTSSDVAIIGMSGSLEAGGRLDARDFELPGFLRLQLEADTPGNVKSAGIIHVWKAIEDAGYTAAEFDGRNISVFFSAHGQHAPTGLSHAISRSLNVKGPSQAVMANGLVALRRAASSLIYDDCELAIAAGMTLAAQPDDMHDDRANCCLSTIVDAESVCVLVLKKLTAAQRDGDHIYAVIRGSAERYVAVAEARGHEHGEHLKSIYRKIGVPMSSVNSFHAYSQVASEWSELESAAFAARWQESREEVGAAGVNACESILLPMEGTGSAAGLAGFARIVRELRDRAATESSCRAALSVLGDDSIHLHFVLDGYRETRTGDAAAATEMIVLSAHDELNLRGRAGQLLAAINDGTVGDRDIGNVAFTLRVGRQEMAHRAVIIASSLDELRSELEGVIRKCPGARSYLGRADHIISAESLLSGREWSEFLRIALQEGKLSKLARMWSIGAPMEWDLLPDHSKRRRVSLPTYPFVKEEAELAILAEAAPGKSRAAEKIAAKTLVRPITRVNVSAAEAAPMFFGAEARHQSAPVVLDESDLGRNAGLTIFRSEEGSVNAAIFYRTASAEEPVTLGSFNLSVAMNGVPQARAKGLILISHGLGGSELVHHNVACHLARCGYVVAAVLHGGDNWYDQSLIQSGRYFNERPRQIRRLLDALLADPVWGTIVPPDKVGAIGHSMGAYGVLAMLGGQVDPEKIINSVRNAKGALKMLVQKLSDGIDRHPVDETDFPSKDERIRGAILMVPFCNVFSDSSIESISAPLKIYTAEDDMVIEGDAHGKWLHQMARNSEFSHIEGAGHFAFNSVKSNSSKAEGMEMEMERPDKMFLGSLMKFTGNGPDFIIEKFHRRLENEAELFFNNLFRR
jgi:polyketide synthase PksN